MLFCKAASASLFSTQGVADLQQNRAWKVIQIVIWSLAGLVVVTALLLGVTAVTLPGCTLCHSSKDFTAQTAKRAHRSVTCTQCHVQPGVASRIQYAYHEVFGMGLRLAPTGTGPIATIPDATCLSCHAEVMQKTVTANGLSVKHANCAKGRLCIDCHSDTAHGSTVKWQTTSQMNECLECHSTTQARSNCNMCHSGRSISARLTTGEWAVTHGPNWKQTHGMGTLSTCAACHPDNFCVRCHGIPLPHGPDFIRSHPLWAQTNRESCNGCHTNAFCLNCHQLPMPHPKDFTPSHPQIVKARGQQVCLRCHVTDDCQNCHLKHVHPGGANLPPGTGL